MDADTFLALLYDAMMERGRRGVLPVQFENANVVMPEEWPSTPWQWTVMGDRRFWFIQIRDAREPTYGRPYQLEAGRNFLPWAQSLGMAVPEKIAEFVQTLVSAMEAQELGQPEAAADPVWRERGEYFNPWASRIKEESTMPFAPDALVAFMRDFFNFLTAQKESRKFPWDVNVEPTSSNKVYPIRPRFQDHWRWTLRGTRDHWWLEVVGPRFPGVDYPYCIDLSNDEGLPKLAPLGCDTVFHVLTSRMDEGILGQSAAEDAYNKGAVAADPPWVLTHD